MSELSGINKGAIYCQETDLTVFCGLGGKCFLGSNSMEKNPQIIVRASAHFISFLVALMREFLAGESWSSWASSSSLRTEVRALFDAKMSLD